MKKKKRPVKKVFCSKHGSFENATLCPQCEGDELVRLRAELDTAEAVIDCLCEPLVERGGISVGVQAMAMQYRVEFKRQDDLRKALEFIRDECDWEGDPRIGEVCDKLLGPRRRKIDPGPTPPKHLRPLLERAVAAAEDTNREDPKAWAERLGKSLYETAMLILHQMDEARDDVRVTLYNEPWFAPSADAAPVYCWKLVTGHEGPHGFETREFVGDMPWEPVLEASEAGLLPALTSTRTTSGPDGDEDPVLLSVGTSAAENRETSDNEGAGAGDREASGRSGPGTVQPAEPVGDATPAPSESTNFRSRVLRRPVFAVCSSCHSTLVNGRCMNAGCWTNRPLTEGDDSGNEA